MRHRLKWAGMGLTILVLGAVGFGAAYQALATSSAFRRFKAPGRMVDIGGYDIHIHCTGRGPSVVLESGFGGWSIDWRHLQERLSSFARVCSYDRGGLGWSQGGPAETATRAGRAAELHRLLAAAGVDGPHVLVGHSLGGFFVREFARRYPEDVAGLVFVDSSHEEMGSRVTQDERDQAVGQLRLLRVGRYLMPLGLQRVLGVPVANAPDLPPALRNEAESIGYRSASYFALYNEANALLGEESEGTLKLESIPHIPLVVLASEANLERVSVWAELQHELASLTPDARYVEVDGSGHFIHIDRPDVVIEAVRSILVRELTH